MNKELNKLIVTENKKYEFNNFTEFYKMVLEKAKLNGGIFRFWYENGTTCVDVGEYNWLKIKGDYTDYFTGKKIIENFEK